MEEQEKYIDALIRLHSGLERQGPGRDLKCLQQIVCPPKLGGTTMMSPYAQTRGQAKTPMTSPSAVFTGTLSATMYRLVLVLMNASDK